MRTSMFSIELKCGEGAASMGGSAGCIVARPGTDRVSAWQNPLLKCTREPRPKGAVLRVNDIRLTFIDGNESAGVSYPWLVQSVNMGASVCFRV